MTDARFEPGELDRLEADIQNAIHDLRLDGGRFVMDFDPATAKRLIQAAREEERLREALGEVRGLIEISPDKPADDFDRGARAARLQAFDIAEAALRPTTDGGK